MNAKPNVYTMIAHGCDTPEELPVPEGCVYVTFALCMDIVDIDSGSVFRNFMSMFNRPTATNRTGIPNGELFSDPVRYKDILESVFGNDIHVHHPGAAHPADRTYINAHFSGLMEFDENEDGILIYNSGLQQIDDKDKCLMIHNYKYPQTPLSFFLNKFNDSRFPTRDEVQAAIGSERDGRELVRIVQQRFSIDQKTLFEHFKGIHYNFVCRSPCSKSNIRPLLLRRTFSEKAINENRVTRLRLSNLSANKRSELVRKFPLDRMIINQQYGHVADIFTEFPDVLRKRFKDGYLLHIALSMNAPPVFIRRIIAIEPDTLLQQNEFGASALHIALSKDLPDEFVKLFVTSETVKIVDGVQRLPIILALKKHSSPDLIQFMLKANHYVAKMADEDAMFLLHRAIMYESSFEILRIITEANPVALEEPDADGHLPIHLAVAYGAPLEVIDYFVTNYPEGLAVHDVNGYHPLHYAILTKSPFPIVSYLTIQYPEGLRETDSEDKLPIHLAAEHYPSITYMTMILTMYPDGAKQRDLAYNLPIHYAVQKQQAQVVGLLVKSYPESLAEIGEYQQLPLHKAAQKTIQSYVIPLLVKEYPAAKKAKDAKGKLPIEYYVGGDERIVGLLYPDIPANGIRRRKSRKQRKQ